MALQTDFMMAVNQIAAERSIDPYEVLEAIKHAIKSSFRDYVEDEEKSANLTVEIDQESGEIEVYADKKVVEEVTNSATQISLADAKKIESKLKVGDHIEVEVTPEGDFGRVAAQTAKQVILQKIRESEKESILREFTDKIGEVETGIIQRLDGDSVLWEVRKAIAVMPYEDRVPSEFYRSGSKHKLLIKEIRQTPKGKQLIVSRADAEFLRALFELEVPELISGSIEIKSISREAGSRSKVAVFSNSDGIDPIGSCVGQKGVRINAIMNELKIGNSEEKIDIILYDEDIEIFLANALSPAEVMSVEIVSKEDKTAKIIVPDDQLSLAIGKEGQNVRLAAKLTGWKIDIQGETIKVEESFVKKEDDKVLENEADSSSEEETSSTDKSDDKNYETGSIESLGLSGRVLSALEKAGISSVDELKSKIESEEKIDGVGPKSIEEIKTALNG